MAAVDMNSDMGEGYGPYAVADDAAMLGIVSSASLACGFHAGDPNIMANVFRSAKQNGVAVGAHPGYQDLWGFGRRSFPFSEAEIERILAYQIGAAAGMAALEGYRITYVKPHGALGNLADSDISIANAVARAMKAVDPSLGLVATALGTLVPAGDKHSIEVFHEIFADRAYTEDGSLQSRSTPGAVIDEPDEAARRVVEMLERGSIITGSGKALPTPIHTICVHSDTPNALSIAKAVKSALIAKGFEVSPFAPA